MGLVSLGLLVSAVVPPGGSLDAVRLNRLQDLEQPRSPDVLIRVTAGFAGRLFESWAERHSTQSLWLPALEAYQQAEDLYVRAGREERLARLSMNRARVYKRLLRHEEALADCARAAAWLEQTGDWKNLAALTVNRVTLFAALGRLEEALAELERAEGWYKQANDGEGFAHVALNRASVYQDLYRFEEALRELDRATAQYEASGNQGRLATAAMRRGNVYYQLSRFAEALREYEQAGIWYEQTGDAGGAADLALNRAVVHEALGDYPAALRELERADAWYERAGDVASRADAAMNRGVVLRNLSRYEEALQEYERATAWYGEVGNEERLADVAFNRGVVFETIAAYQDAFRELDRAAVWYQQAGDEESLAMIAMERGNVYAKLNRFSDALHEYQRKAAWCEQIGDELGAIDVAVNRGNVYKRLERYPEALQQFDQATQWFENAGNRAGLADVSVNCGMLYARLGRHEEALQQLSRAGDLYTQLDNREGLAMVARNRGVVYERTLRPEEALQEYQHAVAWYREVGNQEGLAVAAVCRARVCLEIERFPEARALLAESVELCDAALAGQVQGLGASSSEGFRESFSEVPRLCLESYRNLQTRGGGAAEREGALATTYRSFQTLYGLNMVEALAERAAWRQQNPMAVGFVYPRPARKEEVQAALPAGAALLEYVLDEEGVFCAVTAAGRTEILDLGGGEEIRGLLETALDFLKAGTAVPPSAAVLRGLGRRLLDPVLVALPQDADRPRVLLLSLHGDLCRLPFEILLAADPVEAADRSAWPYLIQEFDVAYVHSGTVLREMRQAAASPAARPAGAPAFAALAFPFDAAAEAEDGESPPSELAFLTRDGETRRPLPESAREVLEIARIFAADPSEEERLQRAAQAFDREPLARSAEVAEIQGQRFLLLLRDQANEARLKQDPALRQARILHLSCHGEADLTSPSLSRLILSRSGPLEEQTGEDGYLFLRELLRLELEVDLLVLAACETNAGTASPLEGITSLSRAGLAAGARAVISTLWKVGDADSRALLVDFYRSWIVEGESRVHALSEAKRAAIRQGRPMSTWAGYLLWDGEL